MKVKSSHRIEYMTYSGFDALAWADSAEEAERIKQGLSKLKHVSSVKIIEIGEPVNDRHMFCAACDFTCRLSQLPKSFGLDTDEDTNPWVWCRNAKEPNKCGYRKRFFSTAAPNCAR